MFFVIIGAPGSGKGTRSQILCDKLGIVHISTGSIIREDKKIYNKYKEQINNGELLSDEVVNEIVQYRLKQSDISKGVILDGYPRTLSQAYKLEEILYSIKEKIDKVFFVNADSNTIYSRVLSRLICPKCEKIYNKKEAASINNTCVNCKEKLTLRTDDNTITLKNRIDAYYENIDELIKYYKEKGILEEIDALEEPEKMLERI